MLGTIQKLVRSTSRRHCDIDIPEMNSMTPR